MPKDVLVGRVDDLDNQILRLFLRKNRLRWKDLFAILARLVTSRSWLGDVHGEEGFDEMDTAIKKALKASGHERYMEMTFVERYLGFGLRPITRKEFKGIQDDLMQKELEALEKKEKGEE